MNVAIIPARGGSKRIPRKNIRDFCGKPMIAWSIEAARESGCFERIVVSTDDAEIAEVARAHGAEVPFVRPAELSDDHAGTIPVIAHAIEQLTPTPRLVCCIYATAPFVTADDIRRGRDLMQTPGVDYAFTVTSFPAPIQRALRIDEQGRAVMFQPENFDKRSQDLEPAYHDAGQLYWGRVEAWRAGRPVFGPNSLPILLPRTRVQDIDSTEDWERAELMFHAMRAAATP